MFLCSQGNIGDIGNELMLLFIVQTLARKLLLYRLDCCLVWSVGWNRQVPCLTRIVIVFVLSEDRLIGCNAGSDGAVFHHVWLHSHDS